MALYSKYEILLQVTATKITNVVKLQNGTKYKKTPKKLHSKVVEKLNRPTTSTLSARNTKAAVYVYRYLGLYYVLGTLFVCYVL